MFPAPAKIIKYADTPPGSIVRHLAHGVPGYVVRFSNGRGWFLGGSAPVSVTEGWAWDDSDPSYEVELLLTGLTDDELKAANEAGGDPTKLDEWIATRGGKVLPRWVADVVAREVDAARAEAKSAKPAPTACTAQVTKCKWADIRGGTIVRMPITAGEIVFARLNDGRGCYLTKSGLANPWRWTDRTDRTDADVEVLCTALTDAELSEASSLRPYELGRWIAARAATRQTGPVVAPDDVLSEIDKVFDAPAAAATQRLDATSPELSAILADIEAGKSSATIEDVIAAGKSSSQVVHTAVWWPRGETGRWMPLEETPVGAALVKGRAALAECEKDATDFIDALLVVPDIEVTAAQRAELIDGFTRRFAEGKPSDVSVGRGGADRYISCGSVKRGPFKFTVRDPEGMTIAARSSAVDAAAVLAEQPIFAYTVRKLVADKAAASAAATVAEPQVQDVVTTVPREPWSFERGDEVAADRRWRWLLAMSVLVALCLGVAIGATFELAAHDPGRIVPEIDNAASTARVCIGDACTTCVTGTAQTLSVGCTFTYGDHSCYINCAGDRCTGSCSGVAAAEVK